MKAHIIRAATPLTPDNPVEALCEKTVPHARAVWFQDYEFLSSPLNVKGICAACQKINHEHAEQWAESGRHLVYVVVNNMEAIVERGLRA